MYVGGGWNISIFNFLKKNHAALMIQMFITKLSPTRLNDCPKCESIVSCHACSEYLPSSGPPTVSQADSDPAAGCSEESEHSGPTDTCAALAFMQQRREKHSLSG